MKKKKIHDPYNKFKGELRAKGLIYADVAKCLSISTVAVGNKISGLSDFYISEVKKIKETFDINENIFFKD